MSQDVSAGNITAGVQILDAERDARAFVAPISAGATPGIMVVTPNRVQTLVFSAADNALTFISNAGESAVARLTLPGFTESFVISPDSLRAYVAVPTAPVVGQSPGVVEVINLNTGAITAGVNVPAVRYVSIGHSGNRVLAFSDNSDSVAVITPSNIGTGNPVVTFVGGFYRPVAAFFTSDDNTAFVVNCGHECGGTPVNDVEASVQTLDLTTNTPGTPVPVKAGSVALVNGATMYLAGTPVAPSLCTGTKATACGLLTAFDLTTMTVTNSTDIVITDGYHNRIALGANGQLFVGARTCTEIVAINKGDEVRGCLSIYNTLTSAVGNVPPGGVVIPPANGDVTGIQPIAKRNVVYLVQGGELQIYDTSTDKLQAKQIDISGQAVDVKTVDF
ncbi:MAG: hypothetical protein HY233_06625 [Acidobacteriales bacterium]|nr:hypothetical protein [Terriglobales bacterium]